MEKFTLLSFVRVFFNKQKAEKPYYLLHSQGCFTKIPLFNVFQQLSHNKCYYYCQDLKSLWETWKENVSSWETIIDNMQHV